MSGISGLEAAGLRDTGGAGAHPPSVGVPSALPAAHSFREGMGTLVVTTLCGGLAATPVHLQV